MEARSLLYILVLLTSVLTTHAQDDADWLLHPPSDLGRPHEKPTNLTIDQAIFQSLSPGGPSNILGDDSLILTDGDTYITKGMYDRVYGQTTSKERPRRKAVRDENLRWPDANMWYDISYDFNDYEKYSIHRAMTEWEKYTCFRFSPKNRTTRYWTHLQGGSVGCNSALGYVKQSPQIINLQAPGCRFKGLFLHEIGHAIGLIHEHQRPDRDNYIWVLSSHVHPAMHDAFTVYPVEEVDTMGIPYDYRSIMHYGVTAFSYNGEAETIKPKFPEKLEEIGHVYAKELAYSDVAIVNKMYKCAAHCPDQNKCGSDGHLDENCNCICKDGSSDCDTTKKDVDKKNVMDDWQCTIFANQGECDRNSHYMNQACAKACNVCGPTPVGPSTCKDLYRNNKCEAWAGRGDCVTNPSWMKRNCPKACRFCPDEEAKAAVNCENRYNKTPYRCNDMASDGDCTIDPVGMFTWCRQSCRWCDKQMIEVIGTIRNTKWEYDKKSRCFDKSSYANCQNWAMTDDCNSNPYTMAIQCAKSCGYCDDGTCKNHFSNKECDKLAKRGDCLTNIQWMRDNCPLSCRLGICLGVGNITTTEMPKQTTTPPPTRKPRPTTTPEPFDPKCFDKRGQTTCQSWNQGSGNYCERESAAKECQKTCDYCGCKENYADCAKWAAYGDCRRNPGLMLRNCQKSCNLC